MKKKFFFTLITFAMFLSILGGCEVLLRQMTPSLSFARLLFFNQFKISRWDFLNQRKHELNVDYVLNVIAMANEKFYDLPEKNRPAFDRISEPYKIVTNADGFRERPFPPQKSPQKSIVVLGDSVGFGKGVAVKERFSEILQKKFPQTPVYNLSLLGCTADCMAQVLENHIQLLNPKIIIFQTSGNDIDQTLWREGVEHKEKDSPDIRALAWTSSSYVLQKLQEITGRDSLSVLEEHSVLAETYYKKSMSKVFVLAKKHNAKVISLNLPFAYTWSYGGHFSRSCKKHSEVCVEDVVIRYEGNEGSVGKDNFSTRTSQELGLSQECLDLVFPHPDYFLDVVHLSASGHSFVAEELKTPIQKHLK